MNADNPTTVELANVADVNGSLASVLPISLHLRPVRAARQLVSGRYSGRNSLFELELRVDIDRAGALKKVSGDFYSYSDAIAVHVGSFILASPTLAVTRTEVNIRGLVRCTFTASFPIVEVTIERRLLHQPPSPAVVQFFSQTHVLGATYICAYESPSRTMLLEPDCVSDATRPVGRDS